MKPAHWRPLALRDIDEAAAGYGEQGGLALEGAFTNALESALKTLMQHPGVGSSRHAVLLRLQDLRSWPPTGFPYLIFYIECDADIVIWRVLQMQRDIPAWISDDA
ncbi:type II toxin-antitoxin system RelE/ParE family toxin [Xanthomonas prunicola]|uniref:Type II toxin-antitoxin system RelE/ParE family toxin n=1 Tax=Xanthomonas prunicola TaxID=2053930 RepID=A0A9Q9MSH8_9XANT|nr:type II toxin-antitoxin system RelE/ParE family toxin [Xanthomonas prunicola]USJ01415.1 type II toxin-antitoxin system RelE/ParE family toxin [Xanthomonas prunicola]UXA49952.1 type II toxin-antitoxin system RelE/ParE family toxin [Xanthomonas prunicola]UXA52352.1 type II toxin-antitoxin system RelE/ParE family toxin [Xanthomonas prunicola]UXA58250.1 type II toxin-antitoxin system RelE/ParE family toxin [Xanthomonas prunicola]UXA60397.1 type II toxin-antitoxin system RelE/ParE family toxin [